MTSQTAFSMIMMGDAMLDRAVGKHFFDSPDDFKFIQLATLLKKYDLVFVNLESPVGTKGYADTKQHPNVTFCSHPKTLEILKNLGVNIVSLGNNHMLDYGEIALSETIEHLNKAGLKHAGAGLNYQQANQPLLFTLNGKKIAFLSHVFIYSASTLAATKNQAGVSDYHIKTILKQVKQLKLQGYFIIISLHWGQEYSFYPIPYQRKQAKEMIETGASLIIGHGPHYPQGIENYKQGQIIYSLGNFIFDEPYLYANQSFIYAIEVTKDEQIINTQIYPFKIINHIPTLLSGREKTQLKRRIENLYKIYQNKHPQFWNKISNDWFKDIMSRVFRNRDIKFLGLPPKSFFLQINYMSYFLFFIKRAFTKLNRFTLK